MSEQKTNSVRHLEDLRNLIDKADAAYYHPGRSEPIITDYEYDLLKKSLAKEDPHDFRLQRVGFMDDSRDKVKHPFPMGSLDNLDWVEEITGYLDKKDANDKQLATYEFVLSHKIDGSSIRASYKDGWLQEVVTRGNGIEGTNILSNGRLFRNLPLVLRQPVDIEVRGEAVLFKEDFEEITKHDADKSNPRNVGNGIIGRDDGENCDKISFIAFDCHSDNPAYKTVSDKLTLLKSLGFSVVSHKTLCGEVAIKKYVNQVYESRSSLPYEIDGVVMIMNDLDMQAQISATSTNKLRPKYARAIKFPHLVGETQILDIQLSIGHTGAIIPTAVLDKVRIGGVYVTHALLNNWNEIKRLDVGIGDKVQVVLAGDIIPKIVKNVEKHGETAVEPSKCFCGAPTTRLLRGCPGAVTYCSKYQGCEYAQREKIKHWIGDSKRGAGILGIGSAILAEIIDSGLVKDPSDLYKLTVADIEHLKINGKIAVGHSRAQMIIDNIASRSVLPLNKFLGCLGIELLGSRRAQLLIDGAGGKLSTIDQWLDIGNLKAVLNDITGPTISSAIVEGLEANMPLIRNLLKYVTVGDKKKEEVMSEESSGVVGDKVFEGLSFCLTGTRECTEDIERLGGTLKSGVSKGLSFLVQADPMSTSGKSKKAEDYGVRIISLDYLKSAIQGKVDLRETL